MKKPESTALVPLTVEVRGEIISSNLAEFHSQVTTALSRINYEPATDEDFAKAEDLVKGLKRIEESVSDARKKALEGSADLAATLREMEIVEGELAQARLKLTKAVKSQKEKVREELIASALLQIQHPKRGTFRAQLEEAIKGRSSLTKMEAAVSGVILEVNSRIEKARAMLDEFATEYGADLISDRSDLELRDPDTLPELFSHRVEQKRLRNEKAAADRARREAEEREKAARLNAPQEPAQTATARPASKPITITSLPMPGDSKPRSVSEEWASFRLAVSAIADQLKAERADLAHSINQRRASEFVRLLNEAWRQIQRIH